ncbi:extracellular solute-binding protein [Agromyces soli]|uniref:Extracellular solute-binding protein n=1 Tax=Agromyces soli TaxID=659012 RepID=A0ABY4AYF8_9MICO|nr:extracellular solute-binding protein [Agromyces soli]UOE27889.1 extracellular solute-binding protein [Agromyces soli]
MKHGRKFAAVGIAAVSASLVLSGCSAIVGGQPAGGDDSAESGTVVVYAAHGPEVTDPIIAAFEKAYPDISVSLTASPGTGELISRVESEMKNPLGDVAWGGSSENYAAASDGAFATVELENDEATVVTDPEHKWHATDALFQAIAVNTERVTDASSYPQSFEDLADPKWREAGQIAFANPRSSGTSYSLLAAMVTAHDWDFLDGFLPNAKVVDGSSQMFDGVRTGEYALGFINEDLGATWVAEGAPLELVYPSDVVSNQIGVAAVIEGAKHPKAAETFVNYLMSKEAQQLMVDEVGRRSARTDVAPPAGLPAADELKLAAPDPAVFATDKDAVLTRFDEKLASAK